MLLLHAGLVGDDLALWAETSLEPQAGSRRKPFATRTALRAALDGLEGQQGKKVVAWLPSAKGRPLPSSPLIANATNRTNGATNGSLQPDGVAPQTVDALTLSSSAAAMFAFLAECAGRPLLAPGILVGADLAFWSSALGFAARLVAASRYLPSIDVASASDQRKTRYRGRWIPRLGPAERAELAALAATMPEACRALAEADDEKQPSQPPRDVLLRFIARAVDQLVRTAPQPSNGNKTGGSLHDQWLGSLRSADATEIMGEPAELKAFAAHVDSWVREATREDDAEYRLCLRLEEPHAECATWFVRYLLQSHDDLSLLVDIDAAWKRPPLRRAFLDAVARAARVSAQIDATLREAKPIGYALDDQGAHAFLTTIAPNLEGAGYGLLLPGWWTAQSRKRLTAHASLKRSAAAPNAGLTRDTIVEVNWKLALGDEPLSTKELKELARLKVPLVQIRGQWLVVEAADIRAALELRDRRAERYKLSDMTTMVLTGRSPLATLPLEGVDGPGELGTFFDRLRGRKAYEELPVPANLKGTLRPYQVRGYSWLHFLTRLGLGACLADDMGLGKTITTLTLIARDWAEDPTAPVLLVCPTSVIGNWQREAARFTPDLPVLVHHGGERTRDGKLLPRKKPAIILTSYGVLLRDRALLDSVAWRGVILDEAQNIKNAESKQAKAARALKADYRVALTGTPIENHVGDLWSLMDFLNPGLLGTQTAFRRDFLIPIGVMGNAEAERRLKRATNPFVLRRLKSDPTIIADLPEKLEMSVFCQLTKEQATLYAAVLKDVEEDIGSLDGIERRGLILATITKLKQICNHPANLLHDGSRLDGRSGKLARLTEMLEEVHASGERALIFTQFTEMAELLQQHLQNVTGREVLYLHGGLSKRARDQVVERFQNSPDAPGTFILSLRAGGTGLNLTRASHVFHFDRWWNPAVENQATDRAYRIGQKKNVHVHRLICAGTIEEKVDALLQRKSAVASRLVKSGEAGLTELSNAQLRELLSLSADAVETV